MGVLSELARRWADRQLAKEAGELRYELVMAQAANERLLQQRDNANRLVNQHEASIKTLNRAIQDWQDQLAKAERQRDEALEQAADLAAKNVVLHDRALAAEASLSGVREQLRQAQREIARVGQEAAEMAVTVDGLGLEMADLERAAQRRVILPGQRADLDDIGEEKRHHDGLGDV